MLLVFKGWLNEVSIFTFVPSKVLLLYICAIKTFTAFTSTKDSSADPPRLVASLMRHKSERLRPSGAHNDVIASYNHPGPEHNDLILSEQ